MPVTMWIIAFNLLTWLADFFNYPQPKDLLLGPLGVSTAWKWLTYPLGGVGPAWSFALMLIFFGVWGGSLERGWGSIKFARIFVIVTLASAAFQFLGTTLLSPAGTEVTPWGLYVPDFVLFVIWSAFNRHSTVLFMFIIPMQAQVMAWIFIALAYFGMGPKFGLFIVATPIAAWFWALHSKSAREPGGAIPAGEPKAWLAKKQRSRKKKKFKVLEGGVREGPRMEAPRPNPFREQARAADTLKEDGELDRILDKIRFEGMDALTETEKATLDKKSQSLRERD